MRAAGTAHALGVEAQPVLVDTQAAAAAGIVSPATVRSWAHRGWLVRRGTGRRNRALYDLAEVYGVAADLRAGRTPAQVGGAGGAAVMLCEPPENCGCVCHKVGRVSCCGDCGVPGPSSDSA